MPKPTVTSKSKRPAKATPTNGTTPNTPTNAPKNASKSVSKGASKNAKQGCAPNIEWVKNPDWTWSLITYLTDHTSFRTKLFSDSTAEAKTAGRRKVVAKDSRTPLYKVLADHIFKDCPIESTNFASSPGRFGLSVETRLRRYLLPVNLSIYFLTYPFQVEE